jgi:hypothetical protein
MLNSYADSYGICGDTQDCGSGVCAADIPYPNVSHESVPSLLDNLVTALYGAFFDPNTQTGYVKKSIQNGRIVWDIPCDPNNTSAINGVPRYEGEGLMCYLLRVFTQFNPASYINLTSPQTISNKTFTTSIFSGGSISGATLSGCTYSDTVPRASVSNYLLGSVIGSVPYQSGTNVTSLLAPGSSGQVLTSAGANQAPYWAAATTVATSAQNLTGGGAYTMVYQQSGGNTQFLTAGTAGQILQCNGNAAAPSWVPAPASSTTATNLAGTVVGSVPYQSGSAITGYTAVGTAGQVLTANGTSAPTWANQSALSVGKATNLAGTTTGSIPYQSASATTGYTAVGIIGQFLQSNGTSAPTWETVTPYASGRNLIQNGNMDIDQRNNGNIITIDGTGPISNWNKFGADRFGFAANYGSPYGISATLGQNSLSGVSAPPGSSKYMGVTETTHYSMLSNDYNVFYQFLDSVSVSRLNYGTSSAATTSLSFYVYSNVTGSQSVTIRASITGGWYAYPTTFNIPTANVWTKIVINNIPSLQSTTGVVNNVAIVWGLSWGGNNQTSTSNTWQNSATAYLFAASNQIFQGVGSYLAISQVQFEINSVATSFEYQPISQILDICQAYYENNYVQGATGFNRLPGYAFNNGYATGAETTYVAGPAGFVNGSKTVYFKKPKVQLPAITIYSTYSGTPGKIYDLNSSTDLTARSSGSTFFAPTSINFLTVTWTQPSAAGIKTSFMWEADTGF